jgi:hypothetical protein
MLGKLVILRHRGAGDGQPRQVDGEDAAPVREVAGINQSLIRFDAPSAEGEAQAHAGAISAALFERAE